MVKVSEIIDKINYRDKKEVHQQKQLVVVIKALKRINSYHQVEQMLLWEVNHLTQKELVPATNNPSKINQPIFNQAIASWISIMDSIWIKWIFSAIVQLQTGFKVYKDNRDVLDQLLGTWKVVMSMVQIACRISNQLVVEQLLKMVLGQ